MTQPLILVSFDIDGTLAVGDPPGPISFEMISEAKRRGHIIGSASDRTLLEQRQMWDAAGLEVDFVSHKHTLLSIRTRFACTRFIHIGDTPVDEYYASVASFEFHHVSALPAPSSVGWVY